MIQFHRIDLRYGETVLLEQFTWSFSLGKRLGLIGPNGSGKTTLFKIATGTVLPDAGTVQRSKNLVLSLFQQLPEFSKSATPLSYLLDGNLLYKEYHTKRLKIENKLGNPNLSDSEMQNLLSEQESLEAFAEEHAIHETETNSKKILTGLGFSAADFTKPIVEFSPGFQHRVELARCLLTPHDILLLDEPTNHLDHSSKEWLVSHITANEKTLILVSHDPVFLNACVDVIGELRPNGIEEFKGSLEEFLEFQKAEFEKLKRSSEKEKKYIEEKMQWIERFRYKATKAAAVQSAIKQLEKREKIQDISASVWDETIEFGFQHVPGGQISVRVEDGSFSYAKNTNPETQSQDFQNPLQTQKSIFQNSNLEISKGEKYSLEGKNGAGKSTFLKVLAKELPLSSGTVYFGPKTVLGYFSQTHTEKLDASKTLLENLLDSFEQLTEKTARNLLGVFSFSGDSVFRKIQSLSGGEQSRYRLLLLSQTPTNLLLLDEPTNHLDIRLRDSLQKALENYPGSIVCISHDSEFLQNLQTKKILIENGTLFVEDKIEKKNAPTKIPSTNSSKNDLGYKDEKAIKNRRNKLEKDLEAIEQKIANLETEIANLESKLPELHYGSTEYTSTHELYEARKTELELALESWELCQSELETLKSV